MGRTCSTSRRDDVKMHTICCLENLKDGDHLVDLDIYGRIILRMLKKQILRLWTGFIWIRIGTWGGLL